MSGRGRLINGLATALFVCGAGFVGAQLPQESSTDTTVERSVLDGDSLPQLREEIAKALAQADDGELERVLEEQLGELDRAERLIAEAEEDLFLEPGNAPPYSLRDLDGAVARLQALSDRREILQGAVRSGERTLDRSEGVAADARRDASGGVGAPTAVSLAEERVRLARFELRNARRELRLVEERVDLLSAAIEDKRDRLRVTHEDLTVPIGILDEQVANVERQRADAARAEDFARASWRRAIAEGAAEEEIAARLAELELAKRRVEIRDAMQSDLGKVRVGWKFRYRLAAGELQGVERSRAERRLDADLSDLMHERDLARGERERIGAEIRRLETEVSDPGDPRSALWLDRHLASLRERRELESDFASFLEQHIADLRRYCDAFDADGVAGSVREGVSSVGESLVNAWNFEITTVDDRPITVGKLIFALILIFAGIVISRIVSGQLRRRLFDRMSMDASLAASLQTVSFYVLILVFFLIAMRFVSIPLTALTFVGGALAIGVGFGSQNIVNNFISGLILMIERPIKVGDMIEVGGTYGRVDRIGGRSTRVRSGDNTHIIVPNSSFLEKEVLNWTLSDVTLRTYVDVGVAYGSPTREVFKLLHRVVEEHGKILKTPKSEVLFMNFGDNALEFRVYFWIEVHQVLDRFRRQSDVRFRIDTLFREAGITIAFPQRDVHLDTIGPLDVRLSRAPANND